MKARLLTLSSLHLTFLTFFVASVATAQVPSYVPTNGLVGYWPFNGNANDASGNGNNGMVNGATLTTDRFGNANRAYSFDGLSSRIVSSNVPDLSGSFSISAWLNTNSLSPWGTILDCRTGVNAGIGIEHNSQITFTTSTGNSYNFFYANQPLFTSSWYYVTAVYNGTQKLIYLNGTLSNNLDYPNQLLPTNEPFVFGDRGVTPSGPGNYFNGKLDDIGIWNRALTADEVLALYNGCNVTPIAIAGSNAPGAFSTSTYTCDNTAGSTYNWTVSNGVIASGQGTNSVSILWGAEGVGSVSAVETTADGCVGDAVIYDVNVQCVVSGNAIEGPVGPEAFSNSIYTCNGAANSTYTWTVTNGVIVSGQGTNSVTILWASTGIGNVSVIETTAEGCVGTELTQDVVVVPVNVEEFSSSFSLFPNPATTELNLQTTNDLIGSDLIIFDALGKQIHKQQILSTNTRINTTAFAAGNYVVKVGGVVKRVEVVRK